MARVKIKAKTRNLEEKRKLLEILASHHVYAINISEGRDGYTIFTSKQEEMDIVFEEKCQLQLRAAEFTTILPPDIKAKRSLILFNCNEEITRHTTQEIETEIQRANTYTENMIENIFKFPNQPMLKITFKQTSVAGKAKENGIRMFHMSIPPYQIEEEEYIPISTCMVCYTHENHYTSQCPKGKEYKICSECGQEGHKWYTCSSTLKHCINCQGDHRTLAYKCPIRKEIHQNKRQELKEKKKQTYSNVVTANSTNTNITHTNPTTLF